MSGRRLAAGTALAVLSAAAALPLAGCRMVDRTDPATAHSDSTAHTASIDTTGAEGARDVVHRYYAALAERDFPGAYALWARGGAASGLTAEEFATGFAATTTTRVEITGPVTIEGAAGSIYATVPVRVVATTTGGDTQRFAGTYVLRRVNDVPGASPEQLRWHLESAELVAIP